MKHEAIRKALVHALEGVGMFEEDYVLEFEVPKDPAFGDLSTNVALLLAKPLKRKPRELAGEIAASLEISKDEVSSVEIAGPGFINFRLAREIWANRLVEILDQGDRFGSSNLGQNERVNIEFVSANPTGPFNIVSARAAAVGSALARVLEMAGFSPHTEFYCNDAGRQVVLLGHSLRARYAQALGREGFEVPEEGYQGEYVVTLARELAEKGLHEESFEGDDTVGRIKGDLAVPSGVPTEWLALADEEESARSFGRYALHSMIAQQRRTCVRFGLEFNTWYLESELHATDKLASTRRELEEAGHLYEEDGAVWFRSTEFGDEKDRVLVKADGQPTYFLADIAYHRAKHARGFTRAIDFFGPDHHGHIARMQGAMQAMGYGPDWLEILLLQQVNLILDGKPLEMSKRAGRLVTMDELIEEVGADVAKFFFLDRKNGSHLDFDLDLAKQQSNDNPVYYVKYAHARICSVLRNAQTRGVDPEKVEEGDLARLVEEAELDLLRLLSEFPQRIEGAATSREMSRITGFAKDVSAAFHQFYQNCVILGEDESLTRARLALSRATRIVLANALRLAGVEAPERM